MGDIKLSMIDHLTIVLIFALLIVAVLVVGAIVQKGRNARAARDIREWVDEINLKYGVTEPWTDPLDMAPFEGEADIQRQIDEIKAGGDI